jgi:hypothetical protein
MNHGVVGVRETRVLLPSHSSDFLGNRNLNASLAGYIMHYLFLESQEDSNGRGMMSIFGCLHELELESREFSMQAPKIGKSRVNTTGKSSKQE